MKIIVRAQDFGKKDEITLAKEISSVGFDGLQLAINKAIEGETAAYGEVSQKRIDEISKAFHDEGLCIPLIGAYFNPVHSNKELVEKNILKFKEHLEFAHYFKADYIGSETGSFNDDKWTYNPLNRTEEAYQEVKRIFSDLAIHAKKVNSNISIEGADGHCMYCPAQLNRLVRDIDNGNVFVTIDVFNYLNMDNYDVNYQHRIVDDCIGLLKDKIRNIHLKDFIKTDEKLQLVGIGEGLMDVKYIITSFFKAVPDANLIFEGVPKDKMESSYAYVKSILDELGNN